MDYSASINESEDPAASPWGSSPVQSPQHSRTGFAPIPGENGSSPFPYSPPPGILEASGDADGFQRSDTANTESGTEGGDLDQSATLASSTTEFAGESHPHASQPPQQVGESQPRAPGSNRQAEQAQQIPPAQQRPQFKLQAKITGLERTGKKDPVLRFDVHVGIVCSATWPHVACLLLTVIRQTSRRSEPRSIEMSDASTPSLSSSDSISYRPIPKLSFLLSRLQ